MPTRQQQSAVQPRRANNGAVMTPPSGSSRSVLVTRRSKQTQPNLRLDWKQFSRTLRGQFILFASGSILLAVVLALLISQELSRSYNDLNTINTGSIPSVDAAQAMAQYMEDIDAKAADYMATASLTSKEPCSLVGSSYSPGNLTISDCDDRNIDAEIVLANHELFNAAHNVTYPGERTAIERITAGFEEYVANIDLMRYEFKQAVSKIDPQDPHLQQAYQAYLAAGDVLHKRITQQPGFAPNGMPVLNEQNLPSCIIGGQAVPARNWAFGGIEDNITCLADINKTQLDNAYSDTLSFLDTSKYLVAFLCVAFCILLIVTVYRMAAVSHRVINVGLMLALLASVFLSTGVIFLFSDMSGRHGDFGQMVKDDYASIYDAALLKRYGTIANGDESRWLIALAFHQQAQAAIWYRDWQDTTTQVQTLMQQALANRTWSEEDRPLADMQSNWSRYFAIDGQIRQKAEDLHNPNRIADAESLSTGESNRTFSSFIQAVDRLSAANLGHYQATYEATQSNLILDTTLSLVLFPLIGLVAVGGIMQRLKDF